MYIVTNLPTTLNKFFRTPTNPFTYTSGDNFILKKSNSTFFHLFGAKKSGWSNYLASYFPTSGTFIPNGKKVVEFRLAIIKKSDNTALDCSFNFEDVTYSNSTVINYNNQWKKPIGTVSANYNATDIQQSITDMFTATGVLNDWDIVHNIGMEPLYIPNFPINQWSYPYAQNNNYYKCITFSLTRKQKGYYNITSTDKKMEALKDNFYLNSDITIFKTPTYPNWIKGIVNGQLDPIGGYDGLRQFFDWSGSSFKSMIREYYSLSDDSILDDLSYYEIGLEITRVDISGIGTSVPNVSYKNTLLTSLSKRLTDFADFEPLYITREYMDKWKPTFGSFNFNVSKYIEIFSLKPYQVYVNPTIVNNTLRIKRADTAHIISSIDSIQDPFVNYTPNTLLSTDFTYSDDYYSAVGTSSISYKPTLLTNQPSSKKFNKGYEILSVPSARFNPYTVALQSNSPDKVGINITYMDNTTHLYGTFSSSMLNPLQNHMFINTLTFKVDDLITNIAATQSIKYIDFNFSMMDHKNGLYFTGPSQRYIVDNITSNCDPTIDDVEDDYTQIVFKNAEGGFDLFEFEAITEMTSSRKVETYTRPSEYTDDITADLTKTYKLEFNKSYSSVTRILTSDEFTWLQELGKSNEIYILNSSDLKLYPIVLMNFDYSTKINTDKKISISFKYSKPEATY